MVRLKRNNWRPDTCGCKITFEFDRDLPIGQRTFKGVQIMESCPEHSGITNPSEMYDTIRKENGWKNLSIAEIKKELPDLIETYTDPISGEPNKKRLKYGVDFKWVFSGQDKNRTLEMEVVGRSITAQERSRLQNKFQTKFGTDNVSLK